MKKVFIVIFSFLVAAAGLQAQDYKKDMKDANKGLGSFNLDQSNNKAKLKDAVDAIDRAGNTAEGPADIGYWQLKGDIYNEIANQIVAVRQLGFGSLEELPQVDKPGLQAYNAYKKALSMAEKGFQKKDALKGLQLVQSNLANLGIYKYEEENYETAFEDFYSVIEIHDILKAEGEKSSLDAEADYNNQLYISGLAGLNAKMYDKALPLFEKLYEMKYDKPAIYEALYSIKAADEKVGPENAYKYLETGRQLYPEDVSLLFADINHYLKIGKMEVLLTKLQEAINKEPDNVSLYSVMGNVYDNLYQKSNEAGDTTQAAQYFQKALDLYGQASSKDPNYADPVYSIGALYYNKAAITSQKMNELADDYSKEGLKKYEAFRKVVFENFDKALPYFQKSESIDPNSINTLIALKEIYAKKDQLDLSNEFKKRLEVVQNGGKNETSYFKK